MHVNKNFSLSLALSAALATVALGGCGQKPANPAASAMMQPPQVSVVTVKAQPLPVTTDLAGRMEAERVAQVRARVPGVLMKQYVRGGSDVKAGQLLFQIDPAPMQAALHSAQAALGKALAAHTEAHSKEQRYRNLVAYKAVSSQDYSDALGAAQQADADVSAARAALETARLNLGYASVKSPITGRIGMPQVTEGTLVGQGEVTLLATVQQVDPIYLDLTESSADMLRLRKAIESGRLKTLNPGEAKVSLIMEDGTVYPQPGRLLFSDLTVDPSTGMITLRAEFPNPQHLLLPGMYARARFEQAVNTDALTIPLPALVRGPNGSATVMVVGSDNKAVSRPVTAGVSVGDQWVITSGLQAGDRVIVEGLQKAKPGTPVRPVPYVMPAASTTQAGGAVAPAPGQ